MYRHMHTRLLVSLQLIPHTDQTASRHMTMTCLKCLARARPTQAWKGMLLLTAMAYGEW